MLIPRGFNYFFDEHFCKLKNISHKIFEVYKSWGYEALIPPDIDFKSTFPDKEENLFRFLDKFSGKTLALRSDFTPQIKKYVLFLEEDLFPLRYFYFGNIYRDIKSKRQKFVTGIELIGSNEIEADGEVLSILHKILSFSNFNFQIDIGHTLFLEGLFESLEKFLSKDDLNLLKNIFKQKDLTSLENFLSTSDLPINYKEALHFILNAYGESNLIDKAKNFIFNKKMEKAILELEKINQVLSNYEIKNNLVFDLSEIRGLDYHTGIVFEAFIDSHPFPIAKGGRYLIKENISAVGFTLDLESFLPFVDEREKEKKKVYILDNTKQKEIAQKLSSLLREKGYIVSRDLIKRENKISLDIARKKNWDFAIVIKENGFSIFELKESDKKEMEILQKLIEKFLNRKHGISKN